MLEDLLTRQSNILDSIIKEQQGLHDYVINKDWAKAQGCLITLEKLQESFSVLDSCRQGLESKGEGGEDGIKNNSKVRQLRVEVKGKLIKSKIANDALNAYLTAVGDFMKGMLEKIGSEENKLYGPEGKLVSSGAKSLMLNAFC